MSYVNYAATIQLPVFPSIFIAVTIIPCIGCTPVPHRPIIFDIWNDKKT